MVPSKRRAVRPRSGRANNSPDPLQVFLNVPEDNRYKPLLHALIFSLVCVGRTPRCAAELAGSGIPRMEKILKLLLRCKFSIHDLSRMRGGKERLPRMNMPFELGIAYAIRYVCGRQYEWNHLEAKQHRIGKTLSNLGGFDPGIHSNKASDLISIVMEWFGSVPAGAHRKLPEKKDVIRLFLTFRRTLANYHHKYHTKPSFRMLVSAAAEIAEKKGLLPK